MKWDKAVVLGCDTGCAAAVSSAALPSVAGVVLCGDTTSAAVRIQYIASKERPRAALASVSASSKAGCLAIILSALQSVHCPSSIVTDDVVIPARVKHRTARQHRELLEFSKSVQRVVHGGGMAAHRRLPDHFAWVLTRFLEEKLSERGEETAPPKPPPTSQLELQMVENENQIVLDDDGNQLALPTYGASGELVVSGNTPGAREPGFRDKYRNFRDTWLQTINFVVIGRALATAIIWGTLASAFFSGAFEVKDQIIEFPSNLKKAPLKTLGWFGSVLKAVGRQLKVKFGLSSTNGAELRDELEGNFRNFIEIGRRKVTEFGPQVAPRPAVRRWWRGRKKKGAAATAAAAATATIDTKMDGEVEANADSVELAVGTKKEKDGEESSTFSAKEEGGKLPSLPLPHRLASDVSPDEGGGVGWWWRWQKGAAGSVETAVEPAEEAGKESAETAATAAATMATTAAATTVATTGEPPVPEVNNPEFGLDGVMQRWTKWLQFPSPPVVYAAAVNATS
jgi:hypothetical protein